MHRRKQLHSLSPSFAETKVSTFCRRPESESQRKIKWPTVFQNGTTNKLTSKFAIRCLLKIAPQLKRVVMLCFTPDEKKINFSGKMWNPKNCFACWCTSHYFCAPVVCTCGTRVIVQLSSTQWASVDAGVRYFNVCICFRTVKTKLHLVHVLIIENPLRIDKNYHHV